MEVRAACDAGTKKGAAEDAALAARRDVAALQKAAADQDAKGCEKAREALKTHIAELEKMAADPESALGDGGMADRAFVF